MSNYNELKLTYQGGRQETITLTGNTIEFGAYQYRDIIAVEVPEIVTTIGNYAFCDNNDLANIVLNEGLQRIEGQAFQHGVYTAVTIPSTVTYIGVNSFNTRDEQNHDQHTFTITCLASTPPTLDDGEGITFGDPNLITAIYVPDKSVSAYQQAWSNYASKIQGAPSPADDILTNLNIVSAYVGTVEVVKMYLGTDVVWEQAPQPIDPCSGLSGESLCNCQGKYWWDDECHDEPEPIKLKLTFDFPSDGRVKLFDSQHGSNFANITLCGNSISNLVDPEGYFSYDPSIYAGPQDVYYYYNDNDNNILGYQFYNLPNLVAIDIPGSIYGVIDYAFANSSNVTSITLNEGIVRLEGRAFEGISNVSAITIPQSIEYIGTNCFYDFGTDTPVVYTFLNDVPPTFQMGEANDLGTNSSGIWIMVPCNSKYAYNQATNSRYDGRFVCSYDEIMEKTPLTFEITSVGTAATGSIGIRLSGNTSQSNKRQLYYNLNHEGTETGGNLLLSEAASNSAITSLITGLTVGDKIEFWGFINQSGMSVSTTAYEYFVTSAGVTVKVYGNINSLLLTEYDFNTNYTVSVSPYAFYKLFDGKSGFTFGAPDELQHIILPVPDNGLADSIYRGLFTNCGGLVAAPKLLATTLAERCYQAMFNGCTSLTAPPELPATALAEYCYGSMFYNCTGLTTAPELPATTLTGYCYVQMFGGCTSLTTSPALPATTLKNYCYYQMFSGCTNLTQAPSILPATTLTIGCYYGLFQGCSSLTTAPELPATTLADGCCQQMFQGCTSLTTAPSILPATTLANYCYQYMFQGCSSLTTAPELPATRLTNNCYYGMFSGCTNLNYIKCLATSIGQSWAPYTSGWVSGVASSGTFVKHPNMTSWRTGNDGIPTGWTVQDAVI